VARAYHVYRAKEGTRVLNVIDDLLRAAGDDFGARRCPQRALFLDLAKEAGATDPEGLARQLVLLYDGAGISAWMDHDATASKAARAVATPLVDAAIPRAESDAVRSELG
jgi:hypothetical protein